MNVRNLRTFLVQAGLVLVLLGCTREPQEDRREEPETSERADDSKSGAARGESGSAPNHTQVTPRAAGAPSSEPTLARSGRSTFPPIDRAEFARLLADLSEPDGEFISDNYVSNETSYLQVADGLSRHVALGGAYLGVGPEQNFTYIALTRPALAFIVDIRRANLLLHLLYKAAFERARGRAHFLALMLSRPWAALDEPPPDATARDVLAAVARSAPTPAQFERNHRELIEQLTKGNGLHFDAADLAQLRRAHEAFLRGQLALAFDLNENSTRRYPTLDELLLSRDPTGSIGGFIHTEGAFRYVQQLKQPCDPGGW